MTPIIELIKKTFTQELSPSERIRLSQEKPMEEVLSCQWNENSDRHIQDKIEPEEIWRRITAACWRKNGREDEHRKKRLFQLKMIYATAATAAILLLGWWMVHIVANSYITVQAPAGQKIALLLPDSSNVWLNAGTTLRYRKNFRKERTIELTGEAFFNVVKIPTSPFKVFFGDACVEVRGTEFNIKYQKDSAAVTLFTGNVEFTAHSLARPIAMKPHNQIIYDALKGTARMTQVDTAEFDWRSNEYRFVNKPLGDLIRFLNRTYNVNIKIRDKSDAEVPFIGTIQKDETLLDILNKICISFDLHQIIQEDSIILH